MNTHSHSLLTEVVERDYMLRRRLEKRGVNVTRREVRRFQVRRARWDMGARRRAEVLGLSGEGAGE